MNAKRSDSFEEAQKHLYLSIEEIKADYGPEFAASVDDGEIAADLLASMAATGEFSKQVLRELCEFELGWVPLQAEEYLK